jgi:hypothetical protein
MIDIHPAALTCLARIMSVLGLEPYIEAMIQANATQWQPPGGATYHVAVAEVMERSLITEPQVGVTACIARHLCDGGFLVPERVDLSLCLLSPEAEQDRAAESRDRLWEYFELSGETIPEMLPALDDGAAPDRIFIDPVCFHSPNPWRRIMKDRKPGPFRYRRSDFPIPCQPGWRYAF